MIRITKPMLAEKKLLHGHGWFTTGHWAVREPYARSQLSKSPLSEDQAGLITDACKKISSAQLFRHTSNLVDDDSKICRILDPQEKGLEESIRIDELYYSSFECKDLQAYSESYRSPVLFTYPGGGMIVVLMIMPRAQ